MSQSKAPSNAPAASLAPHNLTPAMERYLDVKRQNPGWDLLSAVKWEEALSSMATPARRDVPAAEAPETVVIKPKPRP